MKKKIIIITTASTSIDIFLNGVLQLMNERFYVVAVSSPDNVLDKVGEREGVRTIGIAMERRISPIKDLKSLWKLTKVFYREKPYIVHSMTPKAGLLCMMAAWIVRVPRRVHTFTGLIWPTTSGVSRKILMLTDWITCACATHIIPEGKGVMNDLRTYITNKPMRVLGYGNVRGVDMTYWSVENAEDAKVAALRKKDKFTFLFVGRIVRDKGINELVEAFERLAQSHDVRLFLIGRFEDNLDPVSMTTKRLIESCSAIEYVGPKDQKELLAYYAASDCFVLPSYREGFPNTVLEAGAMGLPSIVTDINGSNEIIEEGKNGVIIPSKNVDALYDAMRKLVEDLAFVRSMAGQARQMVETRFEQGFVRKCLFDFYDEICEGK